MSAEFSTDQLLLGFGIDLTPLKNAAAEAERILDKMEADWKAKNAAMSASMSTDTGSAQKMAQAQQQIKAAVGATVTATQQATAATKQTTAATQQQAVATQNVTNNSKVQAAIFQEHVRLLREKVLQHTAEQAAARAATAELQKQTQEIRKQRAEIALRQSEERKEPHEGGEEKREQGAIRSLTQGVLKGTFGESIIGEVATGVVAGEGIASIIEGASHAVERFIEHLREISVESGSIVMLEATFGKLTRTLGIDGAEAMDKMREASEGLVDNLTLLRLGVLALGSSYKISLPDLEKITHSVVTLAETSGHSAQEGITALMRSFAAGGRGGFQQLAVVTGVQNLREINAQIPPIIQGAARARVEFQKVSEVLNRRAEFFGDLPDSMEKASEQLSVFGRNLDLAFGEGFNKSSGLKAFREGVDQTGSQMAQMTAHVKHFGQVVGDVFGFAVRWANRLVTALSNISLTSLMAGVPIIAVLGGALLKAALDTRSHLKSQAADVLATRELTGAIQQQTKALAEHAVAASLDRGTGGPSIGKGIVAEGEAVLESGAPVVGAVAEGAAAEGTAAAVATGVGEAAAGAAASTSAMSVAAGSLGAALLAAAGPASILAIALGAIGAAAKEAKDHAQKLGDPKIAVTWRDMWAAAGVNFTNFAERTKGHIDDLLTKWKSFDERLQAPFDAAIGGLVKMVEEFGSKWETKLQDIADSTPSLMAPGVQTAVNGFMKAWDGAFEWLKKKMPSLMPDTPTFAEQGKIQAMRRTAQDAAGTATENAKYARAYAEIDTKPAEHAKRQADAATAEKAAKDAQAAADRFAATGKDAISSIDAANQIMGTVTALTDKANAAAKPAVDLREATQQKRELAQLQGMMGLNEGATPAQQGQMARSAMQRALDEAKLRLTLRKQEIQQETELEQAAYVNHERTFAEHQMRLKEIAKETYAAQFEEANQNFQDKEFGIQAQMRAGTLLPKIGADEIAKARSEQQGAIASAQMAFNTAMAKLYMDDDRQHTLAESKQAQSVLHIREKQIAATLALQKSEFQNGQSSADKYMQQQVQAAEDTAQAQIDAALKVYNSGERTPAAYETAQAAINATMETTADKIKEVYANSSNYAIESIEKTFGVQQKAIDAQLAFQKQFGARVDVGYTTPDLYSAAIGNIKAQIDAYEQEFAKMNADPAQKFSDNWWKVVDGTQAAYSKLLQYNDELVKAQSLATPYGSIWSTLGKGIESSFGNAKVKNVGTELVNSGQVLSNLPDMQQKIRDLMSRRKGESKLPPQIQQMVDMSMHAGRAITDTTQPFIDAATRLKNALNDLATAINATKAQIKSPEPSNALPASDAGGFIDNKPDAEWTHGEQAALPSTLSVDAEDTFDPAKRSLDGFSAALDQTAADLRSSGTGLPAALTGGATSPAPVQAPEALRTQMSTVPPAQLAQMMPLAAPLGGAGATGAPDWATAQPEFLKQAPSMPNVGSQKNDQVDAVTRFANGLQLAVEGLTSFVSAMTTAKSAVGGAIGGGTGGYALGQEAKTAAASGDLGDSMKSAASSLPYVGAAIGVVMGAFLGEKNAMVQHELNDLKNTYTQMQEAYSSGNATLTTTIGSLKILIAEAQADMANSKKGGSQFQDLINQYNQQLQQYEDQQQKILRTMQETVGQLALPNFGQDFNSYINSLQSVIQQYEQFAGAASTAEETLQAQTYLQQAMANYVQQWTEQLMQDDTQAVQDALQLNQLLVQRNQLLMQTAQQERNILEQGVLTRQQTFAQSKAQQLAQIQYQANLQLEQMNQQIAVSQAKVAAERTVFDLATTRIGLEQQLLQLQSAAAARSVQSIQALANLISSMNAGVSSNMSPLSTQNDFILQLLAMLAGNPNASASAQVGLLQTYQQYASSGLSSGNSVVGL